MNIGLLVSVVIIVLAAGFFYRSRRKAVVLSPADTRQLLADHVAFYKELDDAGKGMFEARVRDFLSNVTVRGVGVTVEDLDRVLVAAGAIIPIFAFPDWRYNNINEVLLYAGTFNKEYSTDGAERNVLGMVGDGALHREMILSQPSLRSSFNNPTDGHNTAIHEFVHLIDKADGEVDGVPEYLLSKPFVIPWIARMHETIQEMKHRKGDINSYGATNDAEFFAVVSEYFFERPGELKIRHPELYAMLEEMFHTKEQP